MHTRLFYSTKHKGGRGGAPAPAPASTLHLLSQLSDSIETLNWSEGYPLWIDDDWWQHWLRHVAGV